MTQRLVGLDVNGWHDRAARNWSVDDTGAAIFDDRAAQRIDGGALSCVVLIDREDPPRPGLGSHRRRSAPGPEDAGPGTIPIGGPGARLAPHGRGDGWGERGASDRRHRLREAGGGVSDADWALAIRALGADPAIAVLAIPDLPEMTEAARERRLAALRAARARRPLLAWSSVLIALSEIEARALPAGHRLRVVEIDGDGLRSQLLTVRDGEGAAAPERREAGRRHGSGLGFAAREAAARRALIDAAAGPAGLRRAIEAADLPGRLALSAPPTALREVVLTSRQEWHELAATAPPLSAVDLDGIPLDDCDEIVVHSPGGADFNAAAAALLRGCGGPAPVRCASPWATAEGGLIAARRMTLDLPLWYDFLPAVDTIVERDGKPGGMPLVPPDAVARAGRVWRSPTPVELTWPADRDRIEVWLRKE
ncbi:MAG: hypothetical protein VX463_13605, partial [Pseudomonadota bacterium]|nr:hypothetical protein [Pseudomonadota bacterium]